MPHLDDGGSGEHRILVVHADASIGSSLVQRIARSDRIVKLVGSGTVALEALQDCDFQLAVLCSGLTDLDPLEIIPEIQRVSAATAILILSSEPQLEAAAAAFAAGASNYLPLPCEDRKLLLAVQEILEQSTRTSNADLGARTQSEEFLPRLVCRSAGMRRAVKSLQEAQRHMRPVLFVGEPGTGKTYLSDYLHARTSRESAAAYLKIPCGVLPATPILARLEKLAQSFTQSGQGPCDGLASVQPHSRIEGTILLEHVDALTPQDRARLLECLTRFWGRSRSRLRNRSRSRVCMTWATQHEKLLEQREWTEAVTQALSATTVEVPPLRSRERDFALLVHHAIQSALLPGSPTRTVTRQAIDHLWQRRWVGNVRELESKIQNLVVHAAGTEITLVDVADLMLDLNQDPAADPRYFPLDQSTVELDRSLPDWRDDVIRRMDEHYFRYMLTRSAGRVELCAQLSGLSRRSVSSKLRFLGIDKRMFKSSSHKGKHGVSRRNAPMAEAHSGAI